MDTGSDTAIDAGGKPRHKAKRSPPVVTDRRGPLHSCADLWRAYDRKQFVPIDAPLLRGGDALERRLHQRLQKRLDLRGERFVIRVTAE